MKDKAFEELYQLCQDCLCEMKQEIDQGTSTTQALHRSIPRLLAGYCALLQNEGLARPRWILDIENIGIYAGHALETAMVAMRSGGTEEEVRHAFFSVFNNVTRPAIF